MNNQVNGYGLQNSGSQQLEYPDERINEALKLIQQHYCEGNLTLNKLADQIGISASHLSRLFKKRTGIGSREYIKNIRMEKAEELVRSTRININEVASLVGYNHASNFNHDFKSYFGISPSGYRYRARIAKDLKNYQEITEKTKK
jgi:two-component system, response regulator YesN